MNIECHALLPYEVMGGLLDSFNIELRDDDKLFTPVLQILLLYQNFFNW